MEFIRGLVENVGWSEKQAEEHFMSLHRYSTNLKIISFIFWRKT
jgi:hypothetical protein